MPYDEKFVVAENCPNFISKYDGCLCSMSSMCNNCRECVNYSNEDCSKGIYNEILQTINKN